MHTSQNVYAGSQTLWYKVYAAAYGKPSAISKIVYVQLVNGSGKILIQNKLPLVNSHAFGNMNLPDSLPTGWYQLRSFTAWMMNFGEDVYYHQNIYIQNTTDTLHKPAITPLKKYHISFYPEGGDMVDGISCNIAFKAVDDAGLPVNIHGVVLDESSRPVARLLTIHDGMGVFGLAPSAGNACRAVVNFPDKTVQTVLLPPVKNEGMAIQVNPAGETEILVKVSYSGPSATYSSAAMAAFQDNGRIAVYPLQLSRGIVTREFFIA